MILNKVNYFENKGKPNYWEIKNVNLGAVNLIVGRNATGKTRLLTLLSSLTRMLTKKARYVYGNWNLEFVIDNQRLV